MYLSCNSPEFRHELRSGMWIFNAISLPLRAINKGFELAFKALETQHKTGKLCEETIVSLAQSSPESIRNEVTLIARIVSYHTITNTPHRVFESIGNATTELVKLTPDWIKATIRHTVNKIHLGNKSFSREMEMKYGISPKETNRFLESIQIIAEGGASAAVCGIGGKFLMRSMRFQRFPLRIFPEHFKI